MAARPRKIRLIHILLLALLLLRGNALQMIVKA
jgi:hypothetical protein